MTLKGYIKVMRPPLATLGILAPLALVLWSDKPLKEGVLVISSVFFGNLGWTMMNEYMDADVDAKNKPWKPIPAGEVDSYNVWFLSVVLIMFSLATIFFLGREINCFYFVGFLGHLGSLVYNCLRKDLLGNVCMAISYGVAALISLYPRYLLFPLAFALLTLAFNLAVQWQDLSAEKAVGVITAPQELGRKGTAFLGLVLSLMSYLLFMLVFSRFRYPPLLMFAFTGLVSCVSCLSIIFVKPGSVVQEVLNRYLGRILLLAGFIWIIVMKVI